MTHFTRRSFLGAAAIFPFFASSAAAVTPASARALVDKAVRDINVTIAQGGSEAGMIAQFGRIFERYADESYIAAYALGTAARRASASQRRAFSDAFGDYLTAKYGRRFREFIGGEVVVTGAKAVKNWIEVSAQVNLRGSAPFQVTFYVSDRTGRDLFFNLTIEGVSLLLSEREEIGAMLDQQRGNIDSLIAKLRAAT